MMNQKPTSKHPSQLARRLSAVALTTLVAGLFILLLLQPMTSSAQDTPVSDKGLAVTPTPTPDSQQKSVLVSRDGANGGSGDSNGEPIAYTRGYSDLVASFYSTTSFSNLVWSGSYKVPIDFAKKCEGEAPPYEGCKLISQLPAGNNYSVRWAGKLLVPSDGTYTFTLANVDDEARLLIDAAEVVTGTWNTGCFSHGASASGLFVVDAGVHDIVIEYRQCPPGYADLQVRWQGPTFADEVIPMATPPECGCPVCDNQYQGSCGDPINTYTGNYRHEYQDISVGALGEALRFKRTFSAQSTGLYTNPLGYGWTHNYNIRLITSTNQLGGESGVIVFEGCGGERFRFLINNDGNGIYQAMPGIGATLTRTLNAPYTYTLTTVDQTKYIFNALGLPVEIRDPRGNATTLNYSGTQMIRAADATGQRYLSFSYDGQGRLVQISDPLSRTVGYGYDAAGNLTVVTDTRGLVWAYIYTGTHLLNEARNPLGDLIARTEYDTQNRAVHQWMSASAEPLEIQYINSTDGLGFNVLTTVITDALGHVRTDQYNARGTLVSQSLSGDAAERVYDANFHSTSSTDPNGNSTSYIYNTLGRPLVITDAQGNATSMQYDAQNHLTKMTDAHGASTNFTYVNGLLTTQSDALDHTTVYTYGEHNLVSAQQDVLGRVTQYAYNNFGERTVITDAQGNVTRNDYDAVGRLITTTDSFERVTVNHYDNADHLVAVTHNFTSTSAEQNYLHTYNLLTQYEYDAPGRQVSITDTLGRVTRNGYDAGGRLVSGTVNYSPTVGPNYLNQYNLITQYAYDALGHQVLVTDTLGHVTKTDYDEHNRPVTVTTNYQDGVFDPARPDEDILRVTGYDAAGNAITQTDALGRVTRTWYDSLNRVISVTANFVPTRSQNDQGEYNLVTAYGYDEVGNQILVTDTVGRVTRNFYDVAGRLMSSTVNYLPAAGPNELNQYNVTTQYGYDASGHQNVVTNTLGWINRTDYDVDGRPVTVTTNYVDGVFDPAKPDEDVTQITGYDTFGHTITQTDTAGHVTRSWYDVVNRLISVTLSYSPTLPPNYLGQYNLITQYAYDELGNRRLVIDTQGRATWTQYDALNRPLTVTQNYLPGQPQNDLDQYNLVTLYQYDAAGRQTVVTDTLNHPTSSEYDDLGRLVAQVDAAGHRTEYGYDALGNRTVMTDALGNVTQFGYDTLNRVITTTTLLEGVPISNVVHYDALGDRIETIDARGNATQYGYDALDRTVVITDGKTHTTTMAYDVLGRRTAQTDGLGHTTVFTYEQASRPIAMADPLGNTTHYGYDVVGNRIAMTDANGIVTRYEYDALNRLSAVVENYTGGALTNDRDVRTTYAYDPMGNRTVITNARGYTTTLAYDALNRLTTQTDAVGHATHSGYDALGNRSVVTDANGEVTQYAYDPLNRLTNVTYTADATTVAYAYDPVGNRTAMTDAVGVTHYTYDDLDRLTSVVDPYQQSVTYAYDPAGNRVNLIYPDDKTVTYTYDAANLMSTVVDWSGGTTTYDYDAANRLITTTLPNGVQTTYRYDNANRLIRLTHTRISDTVMLADYQFTLDKVGNRTRVIEAMLYPDDELAALPSKTAEEVVQAITGHRVPGLSAPTIMSGTVSFLPVEPSIQPRGAFGGGWPMMPDPQPGPEPGFAALTNSLIEPLDRVLSARDEAIGMLRPADQAPPRRQASEPASDRANSTQASAPVKTAVAMPLLAPGDIFSDSFESGNFSAWSSAVTNTGRLSVTTAAVRFGTYGMRALITSTTAMYVRDDRPATEPRYRARFYFNPNSLTMTSGDTHYIFVGRNITGTDVLRVQFRNSSGNYQIQAQLVNDASSYSSTAWYTIANAWHFIEIDWKASTGAGANNGYITLWIDGVSKETKSGIDNDTHRVDEVRLGPLNGLDAGTSGTEYFDAFESRQSTYIGPVVLADFTAAPTQGVAPVTVTFTNTSQSSSSLTAYLWKFGDGYTSTITNRVHVYTTLGYYTVTLTTWAGSNSDTITKANWITASVKADFSANPTQGLTPLTVTFTNTSQPTTTITAYLWNFGDGYTSTITNPIHTYNSAGYFTVTLTAWAGSMPNTLIKTKFITATVKADFNASPNQGGAPLAVTFSNTSYPTSSITSYLWNFGDGYTSPITNPVHGYTSQGSYTVTLTANATGGPKDTLTRTQFITVTPAVGDPVALSSNPFASEETPASAYNPDDHEYLVVWREWSSQHDVYARRVSSDGTPTGDPVAIVAQSGDQMNPDGAYGAGVYLVVWQDNDSATIQGQIVQASGTLSGTAFTLSSGGDGNSTPAVDYNPVSGEFLVVWVNSANGDNDLRAQRLSTSGQLVGDVITMPMWMHQLGPAVSHDQSGDYMIAFMCDEYPYQFATCVQRLAGDGNLIGSETKLYSAPTNANMPVLAYNSQADEYLVAWQEGEDGQTEDIDVRRVRSDGTPLGNVRTLGAQTVDPYGPAVAYEPGTNGYLVVWPDYRNGNWDVYGRFIDAYGTPLGTPFPLEATSDGQTDATISPSGDGNDLFLAYTDNRSGSPDIYGERYQPPIAGFIHQPVSGAAPLTVVFTDTSTAPYSLTWLWNFGDGVTSTVQHPTHQYLTFGPLTVTLSIDSGAGVDRAASLVTVTKPITAQFDGAPTEGFKPLDVTFTNTSYPTASITAYQWNFGDGYTSTITNPVHTYDTAGSFTVTLATWAGLVKDVLTRTAYIAAIDPTPMFGDFEIVNGPGEDQDYPAVAYNSTHDEFFVVWQDDSGGSAHIVGQRISHLGRLIGSPIAITTNQWTLEPDVAYDPLRDQYLVVWRADQDLHYTIQGRLISANGTLGNLMTISSLPQEIIEAVSVAYNTMADAYLVVWHEYLDDDDVIEGQIISGTGSLSGSNFMVGYGEGRATDVAANPTNGEWLVAWQASTYLLAQRIDPNGQPVGDLITLDTWPFKYWVRLDVSKAGNYLVVWQDDWGSSSDIVGQRVATDGSLLGSNLSIATVPGSAQEMPTIAYRSDADEFLVAWQDYRNGEYDLYGAYVAANGSIVYSDVLLVTSGGDQLSPDVAYSPNAHLYLAAWRDTRATSSIYGRRLLMPTADFAVTPPAGDASLEVTFTNLTAPAEGINYLWDFGDGYTSTITNPVHTYSAQGAYTVTLAAASDVYTHTARKIDAVYATGPNGVVIDYTYDGLGRLTQATSTGAVSNTFEYAYDAVGNRTAQTATITSTQVTNYAYDAANRLTSVNGQTYTWDDNGNLLNDGGKTYTYDQANRLTGVSGQSSAVSYAYNGDGARLKQIVNGSPMTYTLDLAAPLVQVLVATDNSSDTRYLYGVTRVSEQQPAGWVYHLSDALGSVRQLADANVQVVLARGYTPYGEPLWAQGTGSSRYAFTGEDYDSYIKLLFLRARWYRPESGGFLSKDVWQGDYTRPQSFNGWAYVEGNPINFSDPTGWCRDDPPGRDPWFYPDACVDRIYELQMKYQVIVAGGFTRDACDFFDIDELKPGTPIPWTLEELDVLDEALGLTNVFLDQTAHPFNGSIGGRGYTIRRVHIGLSGPEMGTGAWPVYTEVTDKVFGGTPIPGPHANYHASLVHEFFHAFDFLQNPLVSNDAIFNTTPDPDGYCGATTYACSNRYENFADNAALYALEWMSEMGAQLKGVAKDALPYFPNGPAHRVERWRDLDTSGHSKRLSFFNGYFFPGNAANWLEGKH